MAEPKLEFRSLDSQTLPDTMSHCLHQGNSEVSPFIFLPGKKKKKRHANLSLVTGKIEGLKWYLLVATLARLMKIRPPESHSMLPSVTLQSIQEKKTYWHQKITQRNHKEQFDININNMC